MKDFEITADMAKHQVKKIKNWTATGKDEVHVTIAQTPHQSTH